jgi:hypothetical protein
VPPVIALPNGVDPGRAVPLPGAAPAERGETPPPLAEWRRRRRRRGAVRRHRRQGVPWPGCEDSRTEPRWIGTAHPGAGVETPGHDSGHRQGLQSPLRRLPAHRLHLPPRLAHPEQACPLPPTAIPLHPRARPGQSRYWPTGQPSPRTRFLALGRAGRLGLDGAARPWRQVPGWPPSPLAGHGRGRQRAGARAGRPRRRARECDGACPPGVRRRHLGPDISRCGAWNEAPRTLGAHTPRCPVTWLPAPRVHHPRLDIAVGPIHPQGGRTGLFARTGALIPLQPALTRWLRQGVAVAWRGHRRRWPRPDVQPPHPAVAPRGSHPHGRVAQRLRTGVELDRAQPSLRVERAGIPHRGILYQPHDRLGAAPLESGLGRARKTLLAAAVRVVANALRGHGRCPAMTGGWNTADRAHAEPVEPPG